MKCPLLRGSDVRTSGGAFVLSSFRKAEITTIPPRANDRNNASLLCPTTTSTMSLSSVANRIQERNNALLSEIAQLDLLQAQHEEAKHQLTQEQHSSTNARKQLLSAVRSRHGLELECLRLKEESTSIDTTVSKLQSSINDIRNQTTQLQTKFGTTHEPIYAQHDVSTKLYSMQSKSILLRAQKKIQHREDKLRHLAEETKRQTAEAEEMRAVRERIRLEIGEMERREEDEDDEMGGLTMQIKQILAK
eukprot:scaffold14365_cov207-Alexandrium_tamarense.AAC.1